MVRGVYRTRDPDRPFGGKVTHRGKSHYVGWFATQDDAIRAVELKRVDLGISKPSPDLLIAHLIKRYDPDLHQRYTVHAHAMVETADRLGVSPFDLPDGWDLA